MRRSDKQITDAHEIRDILKSNTVCRLAMCDGDSPYLVPVDYGFDGTSIYVHSAGAGRKIDVLGRNSAVCFEVTDSVSTVTSQTACGFGTRFRSVIGFGTVSLLEAEEEKREALLEIMHQHTGKREWEIPASRLQSVTVLKINVDSVTGKKSGL